MSGECEKCGEHTLECSCKEIDDVFLSDICPICMFCKIDTLSFKEDEMPRETFASIDEHDPSFLHEITRKKKIWKCPKCKIKYIEFYDSTCWCGKIHLEIGSCKKEWFTKKDGKWYL